MSGFLEKYMSKHGIKKKEEDEESKEHEIEEGAEEEAKEHDMDEEESKKVATEHVDEDESHYKKMKFMKEHPKALEHFMAAVECAKSK
jgi:hypothetical protein